MFKRPLIFAAHADDELTMAGTIWRMVQSGAQVHIALMTNGQEGYPRPELKDQIVALRKKEAGECDKVLGIHERVFIDEPDMGLVWKKETVLRCLQEIRRIRPDALFTHGPSDRHPDHRATHRITMDAQWQAGEPVCAGLGESWKTPIVYYYKGVPGGLPRVVLDTTKEAHKRFEALATQESQFTLFNATKEELLGKAEAFRKNPERSRETFWIAEANLFDRFLQPSDAPDNA